MPKLKAPIFTTEISVFEVAKGIFRNGTKKEFNEFLNFLETIQIIPSISMFALDAAAIVGNFKKKGVEIDDADLLIAGMMFNFGITKIVTKNKKHFSKIKGLKVISY